MNVITFHILEKPCEFNNGGCSHMCENKGDFERICTCRVGYTLKVDGKNCALGW